MRILIAVFAVIAVGCGAVEPVEALAEALPSVQSTPEGPEVFPAGWYMHSYPAYCIALARDSQGTARRCYDGRGLGCVPTAPGGCRHFGF